MQVIHYAAGRYSEIVTLTLNFGKFRNNYVVSSLCASGFQELSSRKMEKLNSISVL